MKHWFKTAIIWQNEDGVNQTIGTQMFRVDDSAVMASLADVFKNTGIGLNDVQTKVYIAKNSTQMVYEGAQLPMAQAELVPHILMGALAVGIGAGVKADDVMAYIKLFQGTLKANAVGAYLAERNRILGEAPGDDEG